MTLCSRPVDPSSIVRLTLLALILLSGAPHAYADVHRCEQADGTTSFQELPCEKTTKETGDSVEDNSSPPSAADDFFDFDNPYDKLDAATSAEVSASSEAPIPLSEDRSECERLTRNAIDAIDAKLAQGTTRDESQAYLSELLELTQALRACKQL